MRLLFDENLSPRLAARLADAFPDSAHVDGLGLHGRPDAEVWDRAALDGFVLVSKDSDFFQRAVLYGPPPKVVWLRIGNGPTAVAERLLRDHTNDLRRLAADPDAALLCLPE